VFNIKFPIIIILYLFCVFGGGERKKDGRKQQEGGRKDREWVKKKTLLRSK
jgi:hypothetical protein